MGEGNKELFWEASIEDVKNGYIDEEDVYQCIICEKTFVKGQIYEIDGLLYDAKKAITLHITEKHGSTLDYLLGMNPSFTGISEVQRELLGWIASGKTDKEIAAKLGIAQSTVRNHRYRLREKEKQSRLFLAVMELIAMRTNKKSNDLDETTLCDAPKTATMLDDRYNITDSEREKTLKTYMDENGAIKLFPPKAKKKIIILSEIVKHLSKDKSYSEKELYCFLKRLYDVHAGLRRALIEYGFLDRSDDGSHYWVKS